MIILVPGVDSAEDYLHRKEYLDSSFRPSHCPNCSRQDSFWKHGKYKRSVLFRSSRIIVEIPRFLCSSCGKVASCIFSFLIPRLQYSADTVATAVEGFADGSAGYIEAASDFSDLQRDESPKPSSSSIFRWVANLALISKHLVFQLQKELCRHGQFEKLTKFFASMPPPRPQIKLFSKKVGLSKISELLSLARFTRIKGAISLLGLRTFFANHVEFPRDIFARHSMAMSTPHNSKSP